MAALATTRTAELLDLIRSSKVLPDATAEATLARYEDLPDDPVHAASRLVKDGVLSSFQAKQLLAGRTRGFRLGDYIIHEPIGTGGMGTVFRGVHQTLGRTVAIKVLQASLATDQLAIQRFLREARVAASLDHPNIVRLFDVGKSGSTHYLTMEYVDGTTLDKLTAQGPIAVSRAVSYIAQAAAGLQHAHEQNVLHRDIKPSNLILGRDGSVKILDMGLARSATKSDDQVTAQLDAGSVVGTADFISPEQALNEGAIDSRSDIYSLGATFYALVSGRPPFDGNTASKLINHQLREPMPLTKIDRTFPADLEAVISKMMAKKPADRYASPAEVILALEPWTGDSVPLAAGIAKTEAGTRGELSTKRLKSKTAKLHPLRIKLQKHRLPLAIGGAAAAVVAIGATVGMMLAGGKKPEVANATPTPTAPKPAAPAKPDVVEAKEPKEAPPAPAKLWNETAKLYQLDLSKVTPFERLVGAVTSSSDPTKTQETVKATAGDLPADWSVVTWVTGHEARAFADVTSQGPVIGLQARKGNAMLFWTPSTTWRASHVRVTMEYQSMCQTEKLTLRLRQMGAQATVNRPIPFANEWQTIELVFPADKVTNPRFEFHDQDSSPNASIRLRSFKVDAVVEATP